MKTRNCPKCNQNAKGVYTATKKPLLEIILPRGNRNEKLSFDVCMRCGVVYCHTVDSTDEKPKTYLLGNEMKQKGNFII